jgi:hypothetical protein
MMQSTTSADLTARETSSLIAADKVDGTEVRNPAGETLGTIERVMIDKRSGKVAYAVMRFGGFLGLGAERQPIPWNLLKYDEDVGGYVLNLSRETLEGAPTTGRDIDAEFTDREWREPLYRHYGAAPYW